MALAGCVSGPDATQNLDQTGASVGSLAFSLQDDAPASGDPGSPDVTETASIRNSETSAGDKEQAAPALAMAANTAPKSAALEAANSAVTNPEKGAAIPSPSPRDTAGATEVATTGTEVLTSNEVASADKAAASDETADAAQPAAPEKKVSALARLFSSNQAGRTQRGVRPTSSRDEAAPVAADEPDPDAPDEPEAEAAPAATRHIEIASAADDSEFDALPGVRLQSLYSFPQTDQDAASQARVELASAAGMARLGPSFLIKQRETVQTSCLQPALLGILKLVQYHYNEPVVITSGYRGRAHNARVGGARHSKHMSCEAADIQVAGVSKWDLANYLRALPGRGGVGTYCYTDSVHIDVGEKRDWNWRCRRRK